MSGTDENIQSRPTNSGFWNFFLNAFGNSEKPAQQNSNQEFHWPSTPVKNPQNDEVVAMPDPFQVIPAPQLGHLNPNPSKNIESNVNKKRVHTEEIKDGGITRVIVGSFAEEVEPPRAERPAEVFSRPVLAQVPHGGGGQSLSVSYKLAVGPSHDVYHHEDGCKHCQ